MPDALAGRDRWRTPAGAPARAAQKRSSQAFFVEVKNPAKEVLFVRRRSGGSLRWR